MPDHVDRIVQAWRGSETWTSTRTSPRSAPPAAPGVMAEKDGEKWAPPCREPLRALVMRLLTLECLRGSIQGKVASVSCPRLTGHAPKPQDQRGAAVSVGAQPIGGRWPHGPVGSRRPWRLGWRCWWPRRSSTRSVGPVADHLRARRAEVPHRGTRRAARAGQGGEHRPRPGAWLHGEDHWPGPLTGGDHHLANTARYGRPQAPCPGPLKGEQHDA